MAKKVPVMLQFEMVECGAASLAMIMGYYGKWIPMEQLRVDCGVSRDGCTAKGIVQVARIYGFEAQGYKVEPSAIKKNSESISLPCIIHWNMNHFVVLKSITKKYAYINDPARGEIKVPIQQFNASFTGIAISIKPGKDFIPSGKPVTVWPFAKERLAGTAPVFAFVFIVSTLTAILGIIGILFKRVFIDDLLSGLHSEWMYGFIALFLGFGFLSVLLGILNTRTNLKISAKFAIISSSMFIWHLICLPVDFFSSRTAGGIAGRMHENDSISISLVQLFGPLFVNSLTMVIYLFIVLRYSVLLTVIGLSSLLLNYVFNRYIIKKNIDISRVFARDQGRLNSMTVNGIEAIETIKSAGAEDGYFERWSGCHATLNDSKIKSARLTMFVGLIPQIVTEISNIAILITGAWLIIRGNMTIGIFFAFQGFLTSFLAPFSKIIHTRLEMQKTKVYMERVQDIFNYKTDVEYKEFDINNSISKLSGNIEVKNLTFGYNRLSAPILENFNMTLKPGGRVALVGTSGCGKSTIAKLISGLYKPWEGEILFDGKSLNEIPREIFTSSISVVEQDIILFKDSIDNNIRMWDKTIENFEVIMAARDAQIHSTIVNREGGFDGKILEGGKNFSGGERQCLEIAGALAKEPNILILDEATSALDAKTEYDLINAVKGRAISMIIIAHRLSTIRNCDEIIVLDKGKIVQRGTHEELYEMEGLYRELVTMN
ncbi:MAG: ATP-binding cassette domain-containing protein [Treponema sp.]|jgi:NHLM bacteriocin system ABC transporter peptidase/ATP-binding protein|nr:ATP-binding cassette domain-containing protein [Treponema sp.]